MGNTIRVVLLLSTAWSTFASAANLVSNPDFTAGLMDWSLASESGEMTLDPLDFPGARPASHRRYRDQRRGGAIDLHSNQQHDRI
jgi:hypothetical protein